MGGLQRTHPTKHRPVEGFLTREDVISRSGLHRLMARTVRVEGRVGVEELEAGAAAGTAPGAISSDAQVTTAVPFSISATAGSENR